MTPHIRKSALRRILGAENGDINIGPDCDDFPEEISNCVAQNKHYAGSLQSYSKTIAKSILMRTNNSIARKWEKFQSRAQSNSMKKV